MNNILLTEWNTPFQAAPFSKINSEDYEPAIVALIEAAKHNIDKIVANTETPTFENTILALENAGQKLNVVSAIFFNLHAAETNDIIEVAAQNISPLMAAYSNDIMLNRRLFDRIKAVYDNEENKNLNSESKRLIDITYKSFVRNGALLNEEQQSQLCSIDEQLSVLKVTFSQNVLTETNAYTLHITNEKDLDGLPDSVKAMARQEAQERKMEGWVFMLQYPSITPFLKFAKNRALRKEIHLAAGKKAFQNNAYNNAENIKKIVRLRDERAKLLGFKNHADFVLQERMAKEEQTVHTFLIDLLTKAKPFATQEIKDLTALAAQDGIEEIMPYDHAYYAERLKEQKFSISEEELKVYFPLHQVLQAAFDAAGRLYGLEFVRNNKIDKYHEEVAVYEVKENGKHKALLYTDFFPRKGKRAGAWMTIYKGQYKENGVNIRPHISIVCNFSRPVDEVPSLLSFMEVTTLFHEFGHALHGMLADTQYESLSGTNVYWDFVELPSQFMENFCYEKEFLQTFAKHYQTGETLPEDKIDKIVQSANFMQGYQTLRQLGFGILDMAYHTGKCHATISIEEFENNTIAATKLYPHISGTAISPSFSHIFAGGYAAGYYSYKWAEVLDADAFAYFKEKGIFDTTTAQKFKTLLSKGGTEDPMQLYIDFRGRKPEIDALLQRAGLITSDSKN